MSIDILFAIFLLLAVFKGWSKGFLLAIVTFLSWVLGLAAALKCSAVLSRYLQIHFKATSYLWPVLSFILVFVLVTLAVHFLGRFLEQLLKIAQLGTLNRLFGILMYVCLFVLFFSVILWFLNQMSFLSPSLKAHSYVYPRVAPFAPLVIEELGKVFPVFHNIFKDLENIFAQAAEKINYI